MSNEQVSSVQPEPATSGIDTTKTEVGSVFVSNYPPYSFWNSDQLPAAIAALHAPAQPDATLGLYLHIPFCRKRCKFCYFRVYTDKKSDEIETYLRALTEEVRMYSDLPAVQKRPLKFVYFGGGTPSFISAKHLRMLAGEIKSFLPWRGAEEITFECEPGTLTEAKLDAIKEIGVTRLSLGVENFNDFILEVNGRAHQSPEIFRVLPWIERQKFDQLNIDLIAGMVGETWETWRDSVAKTIDVRPDSVTVYQMELPFNTVFSADLRHGDTALPLADWDTKRAWHEFAFEQLEKAGYVVSSAYTMVRADKDCDFVYRNAVWHGSDMIGTGVASFSHMSGVHFQNVAEWGDYLQNISKGTLPLQRAFQTTPRHRLIRELILQLKTGDIRKDYFDRKYSTNILVEFQDQISRLKNAGNLNVSKDGITLTRKGLLKVDQLLPEFYDPMYRNSRYT